MLFNGEPPRRYMNSIRGRELIKQAVNKLKIQLHSVIDDLTLGSGKVDAKLIQQQ